MAVHAVVVRSPAVVSSNVAAPVTFVLNVVTEVNLAHLYPEAVLLVPKLTPRAAQIILLRIYELGSVWICVVVALLKSSEEYFWALGALVVVEMIQSKFTQIFIVLAFWVL